MADRKTHTLEIGANAVSIDADFYEWLHDQASSLRRLRPSGLDWQNLAEELEAMAASERRTLISHLRRVLVNFLKLTYSAIRRSEHSWTRSILQSRAELAIMLDDSKRLSNEAPRLLARAYEQACAEAGHDMRYSRQQWLHVFPMECPWTLDNIRNLEFLPSIDPNADGRR